MIPVPLIYAGAALVARYIAKKGLKAATKKYTKKAISEGKKHAKDMVTKPNKGQVDTKAGVRGMRNARQLGRQAAVVGTAVGTVATGVVAGGIGISKKKDQQRKLVAQEGKFQKQLAKERAAKLKAKTAAERAKRQTAIEKLLGQIVVSEQKLKTLTAQTKNAGPPKGRPESSAPAKSLRPKMPSKKRPSK